MKAGREGMKERKEGESKKGKVYGRREERT